MRKMPRPVALSAATLSMLLASCSNTPAPPSGGTTASAGTAFTVGMTVQDLSNQIWSGSCQSLKKLVEAGGGAMTYLDCRSNASAQIQQIEDFISRKVDVIIDGGPTPGGLASTIIDLSGAEPIILREGAVPAAAIRACLGSGR